MWGKRNDQDNWKTLQIFLKNSFGSVKKDTQKIFEWLEYFYQKHQHQEATIQELKQQLDVMPKTPYQIKQIIDQYYSYENMHQRIALLHKKVDILSTMHDNHNTQINTLHSRFDNIPPPEKKETIKEKIVKKLTRNSKNYVKTVILSFIEKYHKISALQLKEMLVEEQGLCSKSSFYRLLQELEQDEKVSMIQEGKNKIYSTKNQLLRR
ncbi:hypothetical protein ACFLZB_01145 [Nanoarchaeota archaeon]